MTGARELALRILVPVPPDGRFGLQLGRDRLEPGTDDGRSGRVFETRVTARANDDGTARFRGDAVQGRAGDEFVYLALRDGSSWKRRWKLSLEGVLWSKVESAGVLQTGVELSPVTRPAVAWKPTAATAR